ncbi:MAG: hypothetical protein IKA48_02185 [Fibrobacter sp.]|nr:hypothetical protein [Fibrobacter sp.]
MATRMGAPGVRIELHDRSGYSLVENPNAVAGVVGFAPRGELNKIRLLTNTAQQDTYFGLGFNNSRYNQGMYATRAVLNAGGYVEFVRPYGEEIDRTDDFKRDLKTDTYVVSFDRNAVNNKENTAKTSMKIDFFASTRYKTDGAARYGVSRKINNVAETIVNNSNVNFNVDAADDVFNDKKNYVSKGGSARGETDMVMFALMNADPSGANRAYTSFEVDTGWDSMDDSHRANGELTVLLKGKVGFAVDDIVYGPAAGRTTALSTFRVTNIVDKEVSLKAEDDKTKTNVATLGYVPPTLLYHDDANAVADGYDYLTVKTAVAGQGAKTFGSLHLNEDGLAVLKSIPSGSSIVFHDQESNDVYVRIANTTGTKATLSKTDNVIIVTVDDPDAVWVGDKVDVVWKPTETTTKTDSFKVTGQDGSEFQIAYDGEGALDEAIFDATEWTLKNVQPANWVDSVGTKVLSVADNATVASVTSDIVAIMRAEELGYGYANILGDIAKDTDGKLAIDYDSNTLKLTPGGALEFVTDDIVAITRASVNLNVAEGQDSGLDGDNILWIGKVKQSDPITDTVEFYDAIVSDTIPVDATELNFQLLNLTQTNKVVYASTDTCTSPATMTATEVAYDLTKKSAGKAAVAAVYEITSISGTVSSTYTAGDEITVTYNEGFTKTTTVGDSGVFTVTYAEGERPTSDTEQPSGTVAATIAGTTATIADTTFGTAVKTPAEDAVMPVYTVKNIDVKATTTAKHLKVNQPATATFAATGTTLDGTVVKIEDGIYTIRLVAGFDIEGTRNESATSEADKDVPPRASKSDVTDLTVTVTEGFADIYMIGNYTVMVPVNVQNTTPAVAVDGVFVASDDSAAFKYLSWNPKKDGSLGQIVVDHSEKVLTDTNIGATFVGLGLANIRYIDVNFTGNTVKVYDLTDEGEAVARLYLSVSYMYNGVLYEFDGTVVKYVYNDMQLYIGDSAEIELEGSGVYFVLNESGVMEMFREDNSYDLSATVTGEIQPDGSIKAIPSSTTIAPAFNTEDPAIINNAVWTYDPLKNMSTSTLSNAFNLFLDKDKSDVTFFVGAGLGLNNFGLKGYETLNTQLMQAVLSICELRKDCFALFDGVADSRIEKVLKLDSPASRFGSTLGRWGAIYDARPIFYDSIITKSNVEIAPSIPMASLITTNRRAAIFWHVPAGEDTGMIPGAWCRKLKYERKFNYPEDPESDIARLCDIHVNPFRSNKKGIYCYGDFTMQMEDTAFNAINVTMLVAGIHKMFYNYLDSRVFRLNTTALRAQISGDLQEKLDQFMAENPAGLEEGSHVICDDTNNPPEVIEAHKLYVDLMLYPTTSTRYIYLRTNVLSRTTGNVISTDISTGAR